MNCSNCGAGMGQHETPWPSAAGWRCHVCGPDPVREFAKALSFVWQKYEHLGLVGSENQFTALVEMMGPQKNILISHAAFVAALRDTWDYFIGDSSTKSVEDIQDLINKALAKAGEKPLAYSLPSYGSPK